MTDTQPPQAWRDLIEGITILARHPGDDRCPIQCSHDRMDVMADPAEFTAEEVARLDELGFCVSEDDDYAGFYSFRFGSA